MSMIRAKVAGGEGQTATLHHRTVWFNAWKYNQEDALWRALLLALLDDLEDLLEEDPPEAVKGQLPPGELLDLLREALTTRQPGRKKGNGGSTGRRR